MMIADMSATQLLDLAAVAYLRDGLGLTALQLEERRQFIGGSDAGSIVAGGVEWPRLWRQKTGRSEELEGSPKYYTELSRIRGHWLEPLNAAWFQQQTGRRVDARRAVIYHPQIPYLAINADGLTVNKDGHFAYIDFKAVAKAGDQLTIQYTAQCTHGALCAATDWWCLSVFVGNSRWELVEQEVDIAFAAEYLERCQEFWWHVEAGTEPPDDVPPLGVPAPATPLITIDLSEQNIDFWPNWGSEMVDEIAKYQRTLPAHQAHEIAKKHIKELIPANVGTVRRGGLQIKKDSAGAVRFSQKETK